MKTKLLISLVCTALVINCCKTDSNLVVITGKITNPIGESVFFENRDTIFSTTINESGAFEISFKLDSARYLSFNHGVEHTAMYVKPGDIIDLSIDTKYFDETIKYEGSPASSFLAKKFLWRTTSDFTGNEYYLGSPEDYKAFLDNQKQLLFEELDAFGDSAFINNEKKDIEYTLARYANRKKEFEEWVEDYGKDVRMFLAQENELDKKYDFENAIDLVDSSEFTTMINEHYDSINFLLGKVTNEDYVKEVKKNIERNKIRLLTKKTNIDNVPKKGEPAIVFTYPDRDGHEYSLSDFKGKLVYIDIWATWCGPCVREFPASKDLEQEYRDKNVSFVGISIDQYKDKWLRMVDEKELGGVQLWAGDLWESDVLEGIAKDYAIYGIPRYLLFSAEGRVISTNAPRPSSAGIKNLLDSNL